MRRVRGVQGVHVVLLVPVVAVFLVPVVAVLVAVALAKNAGDGEG